MAAADSRIRKSANRDIGSFSAEIINTPLDGLALSDLEEQLDSILESWRREFMGASWRSRKSEHACGHTDFSAERP